MNLTLIAREAAAERGALDPPIPVEQVVFAGPTRLVRVVDETLETWVDYRTGQSVPADDEVFHVK